MRYYPGWMNSPPEFPAETQGAFLIHRDWLRSRGGKRAERLPSPGPGRRRVLRGSTVPAAAPLPSAGQNWRPPPGASQGATTPSEPGTQGTSAARTAGPSLASAPILAPGDPRQAPAHADHTTPRRLRRESLPGSHAISFSDHDQGSDLSAESSHPAPPRTLSHPRPALPRRQPPPDPKRTADRLAPGKWQQLCRKPS